MVDGDLSGRCGVERPGSVTRRTSTLWCMTLLRRLIDPKAAPIGRVAAILASGLALSIYLGFVLPGWLGGIFVALGASVFAGLLTFSVLSALSSIEQEARDLWGLTGVMHGGPPWPAPGGWALSASALTLLISEMRQRKLTSVVELGPGTSSVVLGHALPGIKMYGLEHDEVFVRSVADTLAAHRLADYELIYAPLAPLSDEGGRATWYERTALDRLPTQVDVLIVDGPPNWKGEGNRAPALSMLSNRLHTGSLVLVDDAARPDERRMVETWVRQGALSVVVDRGDFVLLEVLYGCSPTP